MMPGPSPSETTDELAQALDRLGYDGLFGPNALSERDAAHPFAFHAARDRLLDIAADRARNWRTRFLAAELIFSRYALDIGEEHRAVLGEVYLQALRENATGHMADWGFLHDPQDTGRLGGHWVALGTAAAPAAWALAEDRQGVPYILPPLFPSQVRVDILRCDFGMLYLAQIHGLPLTIEHTDAARESQMRYLKEHAR